MKGISSWYYHSFLPAGRQKETLFPYICRISPGRTGAEINWFDKGAAPGCEHELLYEVLLSDTEHTVLPISGSTVDIDGLQEELDYEFSVLLRRSRKDLVVLIVQLLTFAHDL